MNEKDVEEDTNESILDTIYNEREDSISKINENDKEELSKITKRYPVDYEQLLITIKNLPPCFKNTRENILKTLDDYLMRENLLSSHENKKFYKTGFRDGIRIVLESLSK